MKKITLPSILHFLATLAFLLIFTPFLTAIHYFIFHTTDNMMVYLQLLYIVGVGFFGNLVSFMLDLLPSKISGVIKNIIKIIIGIMIVIITFILFVSFNWILSLFMTLFTIIAYFTCIYKYESGYHNIYSKKIFINAVILNILAVIVPYAWANMICQDVYVSNALVLPFLIASAIHYLIQNQSNIDWMMARRKHNSAHLPLKIRSYNIILISSIIGFIVLMYIFRSVLATILNYITAFFVNIGGAVVNVIISSLRNKTASDIAQNTPSDIEDAMVKMFGVQKEGQWVIWTIIIIAAITIVLLILYWKQVLAVIIKILKWIYFRFKGFFDFIYAKWKAFKAFVNKWVHHLSFVKKMDDHQEDYVDTITDLDPIEEEKPKVIRPSATSVRNWKKTYDDFLKIKDQHQKLRTGYMLVLDGLSIRGVRVNDSDTTLQILEKSLHIIETKSYPLATDGYNETRYGEKDPTNEAIRVMNETLSTLYVKLKTKN